MINNIGPRSVPCGTEKLFVFISIRVPSSRTCCNLLEIKDLIKLRASPLMPH